MSNKVYPVFFVLLGIFFFRDAHAQTQDYGVFQLRYLYNQIKFEQVISSGKQLLQNQEQISAAHLQEIHKYLALAYFNTGEQDSSRAHFYTLLSLNPEFEPDPVQTSPKILDFFHTIKNAFSSDQKQKTAVPYTEYVFLPDIRLQAAVRSAVLPGWGQVYKMQKKRGLVLGSLFLSSAAATSLTYVLEKNRRTAYRDERDPQIVTAKYDDYNSMSKTRQFLQYVTAGIWLTTVFDAFLTDYHPQIQMEKDYLGLAFQVDY